MYSQSYGFSSSHIWVWEFDHKESWLLKNSCFWIVVLENKQIVVLDSKEIKPVNSKGNLRWIFNGRTDSEAEATILWPSDVKKWFTRKDPDAREDWGQEEKWLTEDEMVDGITDSVDIVKDREAWHAAVHGVAKSRIWHSNWRSTEW